ncbi:MAG: DUF1801 domain-containing protein [bacterium]|nr:DUF1801 domain-containing protein [bacterium]
MSVRPPKPVDHDEYLARIPANQRAALQKLREQVRKAAPGAEECVAWQMPSFRVEGRLLVGYAAARHHCALYPMSPDLVQEMADQLEGLDTSKGTIRFQPEKPLPAALVRRIVKARLAENRVQGPIRR